MVAAVVPNVKPTSKNNTFVPSHESNQWPAIPGRTISSDTTMMREAHWYAIAAGERSSEGVVTGAARDGCVGPTFQEPRSAATQGIAGTYALGV